VRIFKNAFTVCLIVLCFLISIVEITNADTIGYALKTTGEVNILKNSSESFSMLKNGDVLQPFDVVRTTANSSAEISAYGVRFTVPPLSKVKLIETTIANNRKQPIIEIERGTVNITGRIASDYKYSNLIVKTNTSSPAAILIEQSGKPNVSVGYRNNTVFVSNGGNTEVVLLSNGGEKIKVKTDMVAFISQTGISIKRLSDSEKNILLASSEPVTVEKPITESKTSLLVSNNSTTNTGYNVIPVNSSNSGNAPGNSSWVAPEQWDTKTNLTIQSWSDYRLGRTLGSGVWGQGDYISAWVVPNAGTDSTLTTGSTLHLSSPYKLHEVYDWDNNIAAENYIPLTQYYGVASEADLGFNVQLGGNIIRTEMNDFSVADSAGNKWRGKVAGIIKPDNTFKIDYRFMYITPSGEIGYGKLNSPFIGNADTVNNILKSSAQYTLTPVGSINSADFGVNPGNYYSLSGSFNLDSSIFDNYSESSSLEQWKGTNKGIFLGVNNGLLLQQPPSGNKVFLGSLDWNKYNKITFTTNWANGEITGTFSGKYINENIYGTSSGSVFGIYDNAENNYALVASGDITGTPVSAFVNGWGTWDTVNNYQWQHGYAVLAPTSLLTAGNNIYGYGYVQNIPLSGKYVNTEDGFSFNANSWGWDLTKDAYDSKGVGLLDIDNKLYNGNFVGVYRKTNGEAGIWKYNIQSSGNIDAGGYYDVSGTVTNFIPVENALITIDRTSQAFSSSLDWWNLSQGSGSLTTNGITLDANSQHVFQAYGYSLADCSSFPCSTLSWGYSSGKLSNLKYTSLSSSFDLMTNDTTSLAGYLIKATDNLNETVTGKYYGGNVSSNIVNGDTNVYLTVGDVKGTYDAVNSTLNMAMIGTHMTVNSYLSMVDDPAKQPTLQAMNIPITERYNATINSGTFYDAANTAIGSFTTVGLNQIRAFGDNATEGIWTMQINGNHAINADQWSGNVTKLNLSASNLDGTSYNVSITSQNNGSSSLMSNINGTGIWKGSVTGSGSNGMTLTGAAAGTYTGGDGFGVSGNFTGTGGGAWKR